MTIVVVNPLEAQLQLLGRFIMLFSTISTLYSPSSLTLDRPDVLFYTPEPTHFTPLFYGQSVGIFHTQLNRPPQDRKNVISFFQKIVSSAKQIRRPNVSDLHPVETIAVGQELKESVRRLFRGSLAIRQVDAGSDNAAEQELVALGNPFYDVERFGIHFVASPKHADMLMVTGPVAENMAEALRRAYAATPEPRIVVAVGDDAITGGLFRGSYAVAGPVSAVIPVDYEIPGNPPSPTTIIEHLASILKLHEQRIGKGNAS